MKFKSQGYGSCTPCPSCGAREMDIIEVRNTKQATRRRKQCQACSHRFTTYEVSSAWFRQAEADGQLRSLITRSLSTAPAISALPSPVILCDSCTHASGGDCAFGFPEYATQDAIDCTCFQATTTQPSRYIA